VNHLSNLTKLTNAFGDEATHFHQLSNKDLSGFLKDLEKGRGAYVKPLSMSEFRPRLEVSKSQLLSTSLNSIRFKLVQIHEQLNRIERAYRAGALSEFDVHEALPGECMRVGNVDEAFLLGISRIKNRLEGGYPAFKEVVYKNLRSQVPPHQQSSLASVIEIDRQIQSIYAAVDRIHTTQGQIL